MPNCAKTLTVAFAIICFFDCFLIFRNKNMGFIISIFLLAIQLVALITRGSNIMSGHIKNMFDYDYSGIRYPIFLICTIIIIALNIIIIKKRRKS